MSLHLSAIAKTTQSSLGDHFSAHRLERGRLRGFIEPIMGFDHFVMSGPTFAPHPHAGFSAITYIFEDAQGAMRNRDSLGNNVLIQPGEMVWTQAASGVIHDESPEVTGKTVHGLQLFVNLASKNKHIAPEVFYLSNADIPVVETDAGNRIRVLSGALGDAVSPVEQVEPFDFMDVTLVAPYEQTIRSNWNAMVYVLSGTVRMGADAQSHQLEKNQAIGIHADDEGGEIHMAPQGEARILFFAGQDSKEPVAVHGPFIMNTPAEIELAFSRYRNGEMGRL
ncbi:pirin C-terminal domain protein [delta proteobacterium NaphS2]|nr:pirin C-terminal domain protein [delta proteobacterium NaphS2]